MEHLVLSGILKKILLARHLVRIYEYNVTSNADVQGMLGRRDRVTS